MKTRKDGADQGIPRYHESIKQANRDYLAELLIGIDEGRNPEREA